MTNQKCDARNWSKVRRAVAGLRELQSRIDARHGGADLTDAEVRSAIEEGRR